MAKSTFPELPKVRNIGVIAHIDAGKTTTTEHLLYYAAAKHKLGGVDEGTTDTDYDPEEQARGITIYSACVPFEWAGHTIDLIDTKAKFFDQGDLGKTVRVADIPEENQLEAQTYREQLFDVLTAHDEKD